MAEITPEMVLEVTTVTRARAERIAAYAALRFGGLLVTDAAREAGLTDPTARSYEKWVPLLRERFGLPEAPKGGPMAIRVSFERYRQAGRSGGHQSQHVAKGIVSPDCPLCQGGAE